MFEVVEEMEDIFFDVDVIGVNAIDSKQHNSCSKLQIVPLQDLYPNSELIIKLKERCMSNIIIPEWISAFLLIIQILKQPTNHKRGEQRNLFLNTQLNSSQPQSRN